MRKHLWPFIFVISFLHLTAQGRQAIELGIIKEELWYFDPELSSFRPSFKVAAPDQTLLGFYADLNTDNPEVVRICIPRGTSVWANNQLIISETFEDCITADLSEWRKDLGIDSVFIVLHHQPGILESARINRALKADTSVADTIILMPLYRTRSSIDQFVLTFIIFFLAILGFFRLQFVRIFRSFTNLNRVLSFGVRDETVSGFRLLSAQSITIHLLVSMLIGFFIVLYTQSYQTEGATFVTIVTRLYEWLLYSGAILFFLLTKRLVIQLFGSVFQLRGAVYVQVFEYLRSIFLFFSAALVLYVLAFYLWAPASIWIINHLFGISVWFVSLTLLLVFYKLAFETRYQKLLLFSYLCATEILPAILLLKWILP